MPLSWMISSMFLLVVMMVVLFLYSVCIIEMSKFNNLNEENNFFLWW